MLPPGCNGCGGAGEITALWVRLSGHMPPWEGCCDAHDLAYTQGGPAEWRAWADRLLRDCMIQRGYPVRAWAYWLAVRLFGASHWGRA
ncbi:hypothetical protein dsx2_2508 [Desulfovibrio sp. X2]|nr:hypothetical protein dsx2_2508 [Desulfovibrio sp. X2]